MIQTYVLVMTLFIQGGQGWDEGSNAVAIHHISDLSELRCRSLANEWVKRVSAMSKRMQASAICMPTGVPTGEVRPLT